VAGARIILANIQTGTGGATLLSVQWVRSSTSSHAPDCLFRLNTPISNPNSGYIRLVCRCFLNMFLLIVEISRYACSRLTLIPT
jgi:hypothetical protein